MTWKYSDDNPYAKLRLVSDPAFGADYGIGLRADTLKQVAISKADCWEEGYHHRDEEVAKLRKVLEIAEDMLAHIECPAHGVSFDSYGATEDLWLRLVENDECTFCATHCNEDGRDSHPWRCWLDLLTAMAEDQEVQDDG